MSPPDESRRPRRGRGTRILALVVAGAVLLWCGYWVAGNRVAAMAFERVTESLGADGRELGCGTNHSGGFPFRLDLDCSGMTYRDSRAGLAVAMARLTATAPLYRPGAVEAVLSGPLMVAIPGRDLAIKASWATATAEANASLGGLNGGSFRFEGFAIEPDGGRNRLPFTRLSAAHAAGWAIPLAGGDYRLSFDAADVGLTPKKGKDLPPLALSVDLIARGFGSRLGTDPARTLALWVEAGGTLDIERFAVTLGEAGATATGQLSVSPEGLVSGDIVVRIAGLDAIPALAERLRLGSRDKVKQLLAAAGAFTRPAPDQPGAREVPLAIRNGVVMVGMVPLASIPPLSF
jgi:hypothetical protein